MKHGKSLLIPSALLALAGGFNPSAQAAPLGTAFNYQGRLEQNGQTTTNGLYGMRFALHDVASGGTFLGKAMSALKEGTGLVLVLVTLQ